MNLSSLTLNELRSLQEDVKSEIKKRQHDELVKAREQIIAIAQSVGMPLKELMGGNLRVKSGPAGKRYRNPSDASQQWAGRGRQPNWVKAWLASGKSLDLLKI